MDEMNRPGRDIFLRVGETGNFSDFMPIQYLTNRELRQGHNIAKMYVAGEFDDLYSRSKHEINFNTHKEDFFDGTEIENID